MDLSGLDIFRLNTRGEIHIGFTTAPGSLYLQRYVIISQTRVLGHMITYWDHSHDFLSLITVREKKIK